MQTGVEVFLEGLRSLGHKPITLPDNPNHLVVDYTVESGKFAGTKLRLGFVVPADFPMTTPTGPHVRRVSIPLTPRATLATRWEACTTHNRQSLSKVRAASGNTGHGPPPLGPPARRRLVPT